MKKPAVFFVPKNQKGGQANGIPYHNGNDSRKRGESFEEVRAQLNAYRESLNNPDSADLLDLDYLAGTVAVVAVTAVALEDNGPVRDATSMRQHIDSKAYRERQRKRIAMGHKPDDHEDEKPTWSQQMY